MKYKIIPTTPVVYTPLDDTGEKPDLVVVSLKDLIEAQKKHIKAIKQAQEEGWEKRIRFEVKRNNQVKNENNKKWRKKLTGIRNGLNAYRCRKHIHALRDIDNLLSE